MAHERQKYSDIKQLIFKFSSETKTTVCNIEKDKQANSLYRSFIGLYIYIYMNQLK